MQILNDSSLYNYFVRDIFIMYKRPIKIFIVSIITGLFPMLVTLLAALIASVGKCDLHEGYSNPCIMLGADIGNLLYKMGIVFWFSIITIPMGAIGIIVSLIWLIKFS